MAYTRYIEKYCKCIKLVFHYNMISSTKCIYNILQPDEACTNPRYLCKLSFRNNLQSLSIYNDIVFELYEISYAIFPYKVLSKFSHFSNTFNNITHNTQPLTTDALVYSFAVLNFPSEPLRCYITV